MKDKIIAALRASYPGTQAALLDRVADTLAGTVTEETLETITTSDGVKNLLAFFQSETDRRATEASKTAISNYEKQFNLKEGKSLSVSEPPPPITNTPAVITTPAPLATEAEPPLWAKALIEQNNQLKDKIQLIEKGAQKAALMEKVRADMDKKKIPQALLMGRTVEKEEDVDELMKTIEGNYQAVKQEMTNQGVVINVPVTPVPKSTKVEAEIEQWVNNTKSKMK